MCEIIKRLSAGARIKNLLALQDFVALKLDDDGGFHHYINKNRIAWKISFAVMLHQPSVKVAQFSVAVVFSEIMKLAPKLIIKSVQKLGQKNGYLFSVGEMIINSITRYSV